MRAYWFVAVPVSLALVPFPPQDPAQQPAMLQRAEELATVGPAHQRLAKLVGSWNVELRTTPRQSAEQEGRGTATGTALLGGRYVQVDFQLTLQDRPVRALQLLGFDALRQLYTSSWRDDLSTWSVECSGVPMAEAAGVLRMQGTLADVREPAGHPFRLEMDLSVENVVQVRVFETVAGEEQLVQSQRWSR